jgi:hypothetical protein
MLIKPDGSGDMVAEFKTTMTGNLAGYYRRASHELVGEKWNRWIENWASQSYPQLTILKQSFAGKEDNDKPFTIDVTAKLAKALQPAGRGVSLEVKPLLIGGLIDYFKLPKRRYTMELSYKSFAKIRYEVVIPKGMEPVGLPKNVTFEDEFIKYERMSQIENDRVVTEFTGAIKVIKIPPDKYPAARKVFQGYWDTFKFVLMFEPAKTKSKKS